MSHRFERTFITHKTTKSSSAIFNVVEEVLNLLNRFLKDKASIVKGLLQWAASERTKLPPRPTVFPVRLVGTCQKSILKPISTQSSNPVDRGERKELSHAGLVQNLDVPGG